MYTILEDSVMDKRCISQSNLENTGFNYTMSLIQGK